MSRTLPPWKSPGSDGVIKNEVIGRGKNRRGSCSSSKCPVLGEETDLGLDFSSHFRTARLARTPKEMLEQSQGTERMPRDAKAERNPSTWPGSAVCKVEPSPLWGPPFGRPVPKCEVWEDYQLTKMV